MATYNLPYFGELNYAALEDYYDVKIDFQGKQIRSDLNFETTSIAASKMDDIANFLAKLDVLDQQNKVYIQNDYDDTDADEVRFYLRFHFEEFDEDELAHLIDYNDKSKTPEQQLFEQLHLVRVGLYPDNDAQFAIFDYSIGKDLTNYILVIVTNKNGNLDHITVES